MKRFLILSSLVGHLSRRTPCAADLATHTSPELGWSRSSGPAWTATPQAPGRPRPSSAISFPKLLIRLAHLSCQYMSIVTRQARRQPFALEIRSRFRVRRRTESCNKLTPSAMLGSDSVRVVVAVLSPTGSMGHGFGGHVQLLCECLSGWIIWRRFREGGTLVARMEGIVGDLRSTS